jgi:DNA-damage-inducible protein D
VDNHFTDISKMVKIGSNSVRKIKDWKLDHYACYLIAQNGDSKKEEIALENKKGSGTFLFSNE